MQENPYGRFYNGLLRGELGYTTQQVFKSRLPWPMRDYIPCLNPTVIVLRKTGRIPAMSRSRSPDVPHTRVADRESLPGRSPL